MLKLKLQDLGHLMWRADSLKRPWCWERLREGGEGDDRGWDGWMASLTQWTWVWVNPGSLWWTGSLVCCCSWSLKESDTTEWLNWTELFMKDIRPASHLINPVQTFHCVSVEQIPEYSNQVPPGFFSTGRHFSLVSFNWVLLVSFNWEVKYLCYITK